MSERRAEITWTDPAVALERIGSTSGIDYLRGVLAGSIPTSPMLSTLGIELVSASMGDVELRCETSGMLDNQIGSVHGGFVSTMLDTACGLAGCSTQAAGVTYTSIDLSVRFLRPIMAGEVVRAFGTAVKPGRKVIATEGRLVDVRGRLLATATSSLLVLPVDR